MKLRKLFLAVLTLAIFQGCIPTGGGVTNPNAFTIGKTVNQLSYPGNGVWKAILFPFIDDSIIIDQYDWPSYGPTNITNMQFQAPTDMEMIADSAFINGNRIPRPLAINSTLDGTVSGWINPYYDVYLMDQDVEYNRVLNIPTANNTYTALLPNGVYYFGFRCTKTTPYTYFWLRTEIKDNLNGSKQFVIYNGAWGSGGAIVGK